MEKKLVARASRTINASPARVWDALVNPELVKQYLFGTEVSSDWKVGSPIVWKGVWQGKPYEDKGTVLKVVPGRLLETTYFSGNSGLPDVPDNYKKVTYELAPVQGGTKLTLTQDNNASEEEKNHSEQNWNFVLDGLKKLLEG